MMALGIGRWASGQGILAILMAMLLGFCLGSTGIEIEACGSHGGYGEGMFSGEKSVGEYNFQV